ncbi:MAG: SDR family oxidoreductase [Pseudomonadota bacterium]|nr:SDR family oxidoreductase [Pseudomonadota bacterium]
MNINYLITGANRGIGLALAEELISNGEKVISLYRRSSDSDKLISLQSKNPSRVELHKADVTVENDLISTSKKIENLDVLICNAGIMGARGGMMDENNNYNIISDVLMTNVAGPFFTIRAFLNQIKQSKNPKIIIISSHMGSQKHTGSESYFYRASKAAINNIMITFSNELRVSEIPIVCVHPGWVRTEMGGSFATLSTQESARSLYKFIQKIDMAKSGHFYNYDGNKLDL